MNTVEKFEGDWVRIEKVMENPKNRQIWNFRIQEMEFGIGSQGRNMKNGFTGVTVNFQGK